MEFNNRKIVHPPSCNISNNDIWHRMGYIAVFNNFAGNPYVALLVSPIVIWSCGRLASCSSKHWMNAALGLRG